MKINISSIQPAQPALLLVSLWKTFIRLKIWIAAYLQDSGKNKSDITNFCEMFRDIFWYISVAAMYIPGEWTLLIHVSGDKGMKYFPTFFNLIAPACLYV